MRQNVFIITQTLYFNCRHKAGTLNRAWQVKPNAYSISWLPNNSSLIKQVGLIDNLLAG
jgi:hypothetical protein